MMNHILTEQSSKGARLRARIVTGWVIAALGCIVFTVLVSLDLFPYGVRMPAQFIAGGAVILGALLMRRINALSILGACIGLGGVGGFVLRHDFALGIAIAIVGMFCWALIMHLSRYR